MFSRIRRRPAVQDHNWDGCGTFHPNCGKSILLKERRLIAEFRHDGCIEGMVFSAKPIPTGRMFRVKILRMRGAIAIGFTSLDPNSIDLAPIKTEDYEKRQDLWIISGNKTWCGGVSQTDLEFSTDDLDMGDSVGICVHENGQMYYWVNGKSMGPLCQISTSVKLWGFLNIIGDGRIQSQFHFGTVTERQILQIAEKFSSSEENVSTENQEMLVKSIQPATDPQEQKICNKESSLSQPEVSTDQQGLPIALNKELTDQVERLTREVIKLQEENRAFASQLERQSNELSELQNRSEHLTTDLCHKLTTVLKQQLQMHFITLKRDLLQDTRPHMEDRLQSVAGETQSLQSPASTDTQALNQTIQSTENADKHGLPMQTLLTLVNEDKCVLQTQIRQSTGSMDDNELRMNIPESNMSMDEHDLQMQNLQTPGNTDVRGPLIKNLLSTESSTDEGDIEMRILPSVTSTVECDSQTQCPRFTMCTDKHELQVQGPISTASMHKHDLQMQDPPSTMSSNEHDSQTQSPLSNTSMEKYDLREEGPQVTASMDKIIHVGQTHSCQSSASIDECDLQLQGVQSPANITEDDDHMPDTPSTASANEHDCQMKGHQFTTSMDEHDIQAQGLQSSMDTDKCDSETQGLQSTTRMHEHDFETQSLQTALSSEEHTLIPQIAPVRKNHFSW